MADYIEKQAAVSYAISGMVRTLPTNDGNENWIRTSEVRKNILSIPAADVVPVVRCKYCRYRVDPDKCCHPDGMLRRKNDDFCSYGERKEA